MPGLVLREFDCTFCGQRFSLLSGDLILPGPELCDDCLREVWALKGEDLEQCVSRCAVDAGPALVDDVRAYLQGYRARYAKVEEVIYIRDSEQRAF